MSCRVAILPVTVLHTFKGRDDVVKARRRQPGRTQKNFAGGPPQQDVNNHAVQLVNTLVMIIVSMIVSIVVVRDVLRFAKMDAGITAIVLAVVHAQEVAEITAIMVAETIARAVVLNRVAENVKYLAVQNAMVAVKVRSLTPQ